MAGKDSNTTYFLGKYWWTILCSGILFIVLGIWILEASVSAYFFFTLLFSAGMTLAGVFEITFVMDNYKKLRVWSWALIGGLIDFLLGACLLNIPLLTILLMPVIVGVWLILRGLMMIGNPMALQACGILDWVWFLFTGIAIIMISVLVMVHPFFASVSFVAWTAFVFFLSGIFRILISLQLRNFWRKAGANEHPKAWND